MQDKIDSPSECCGKKESDEPEMPALEPEEFLKRREALKKMAAVVTATPPAVLGLLYSKRALATSGE